MIAKLGNVTRLLCLMNCAIWHARGHEFDYIALVHNWFHI